MVNCERCGTSRSRLDNYCPHCGAEIPAQKSPGPTKLSLARVPSALPVSGVPIGPRVWQGLAALVFGTLVELLRREAVRRLSTPPAPRAMALREEPGALALLGEESSHGQDEYELHETIYVRRVIRRRR